MQYRSPLAPLAATLVLAACGGDEPEDQPGADTSVDADGGDTEIQTDAPVNDEPDEGLADADAAAEIGEDVEPDEPEPDEGSGEDATDDGSGEDDADDVFEPILGPVLEFEVNWPIFEAPTDPLDADDGCTVYQEERCEGGSLQRCEVFDTDDNLFLDLDLLIDEGGSSATEMEMLQRAYLYDRWYDLHSSPDGQTAERVYTQEMPPGTPEEVWADPQYLAGWAGAGDSAIWTGTALNGFILRYLVTGTEADYRRMEEKTRVMVNFFEVTRIPGYLARYHYLLVPEGTPANPDHIYQFPPDTNLDNRDIEDPATLGFLPADYFEVEGTPRWSGDPSIDQYNGPMVAFPMVYGLLRDEALKERIAYHMVCYLHSLRRIEIRNLQANEAALQAFNDLFAGGSGLNLDPGDIDFMTIDKIVMYVHPQINVNNEDTYDRTCGDFVQLEPWRVIDATSRTFVPDLLTLVQDIARPSNRPNQINHFYIPSIRGGDAMHMMHLTTMAHAFTGDDRYIDFLQTELMQNIRTAEVAKTMSAYLLPKFCRRFYGTNITAGPLWAFNNLLRESPLDTWMQEVSLEEMYLKETRDIGNVNTNLMFAGSVSPEIGGEYRDEAIAYALEELPRFGGNGGILNDPRRTYNRQFEDVVAQFPEGTTVQCPTEEERQTCGREISVFGVALPSDDSIDYECTGAAWECEFEDGMCADAAASHPLPGPIRKWGDYIWQRSAFAIGDRGGAGNVQAPGTDYAEQYWMARFYGFIEGNRHVLRWREVDACGDGSGE